MDMNNQRIESVKEDCESKEVLALPSSTESSEGVRQFSLGQTLKLDELGPIIINTDGTTRRISNWDTLSKQEQETTWRVIRIRNQKRLLELKKAIDEEKETTESTDSNSS